MNQWIEVYAPPAEPKPLLTLLQREGAAPHAPCGGRGNCGKCKVMAEGALSPMTGRERGFLREAEVSGGVRLACLTLVCGKARACPLPDGEQVVLSAGVLPDFCRDRFAGGYGLAVDIGTTTVAAYLYRLDTGAPIAAASCGNPQGAFGADVISRIEQSLAGRRSELAGAVLGCIGSLSGQLCKKAGIAPEQILRAALTGNTAMLYLLTGREASSLAAAPFAPDCLFGESVDATQLGLSLASGAQAYLPRCIAAYVGADMTCAILAGRLFAAKEPELLVDIGTNGEMALCVQGKLYACSTAAGPAFEGAGISMGMNGGTGAVDHVWLTDGQIRYSVIGGGPAKGICGSGLIDAAAVLREAGLLDETGRIPQMDETASPYLTEQDGMPAVKLGESGVWLTQKDVRALQLAKSAICAGMRALLHEAGLSPDKVERLTIAGGFGSFIDPANAEKIGMLPRGFAGKARVIGNAAGMGTGMVLLSREERLRSEALARACRVVELSGNPYFMERYVEDMLFEEPPKG